MDLDRLLYNLNNTQDEIAICLSQIPDVMCPRSLVSKFISHVRGDNERLSVSMNYSGKYLHYMFIKLL